jgi:hypothetical protein
MRRLVLLGSTLLALAAVRPAAAQQAEPRPAEGGGISEAAAQRGLAPGPYTLTLQLQHINGVAVPGSSAVPSRVIAAVRGDSVTIAQEDGTLLLGHAADGVLNVAGRGHEASLSLTGPLTPSGARGVFQMRSGDGRVATGTFTLEPPRGGH